MPRLDCLIFGALGGACPTIAKLAGYYTTKPESPLPELGVWIGLGLFAILGAIIAIGFGARELKAALIAGIAAPGIVTNVVAGAQTPEKPVQVASYLLGAGPAYAQTPTEWPLEMKDSTLTQGGRLIAIVPSVNGGQSGDLGLAITALVTENGVKSQLPVGQIQTDTALNVVVPEGTTALQIGPTVLPLSPEETSVAVRIDTSPTFSSELLWALGGKRNYEVTDVTLQPPPQ